MLIWSIFIFKNILTFLIQNVMNKFRNSIDHYSRRNVLNTLYQFFHIATNCWIRHVCKQWTIWSCPFVIINLLLLLLLLLLYFKEHKFLGINSLLDASNVSLPMFWEEGDLWAPTLHTQRSSSFFIVFIYIFFLKKLLIIF